MSSIPDDPKTGSTDIKIRVIEVTLDDGSKEYLATNVFDTSLNADDFKELYFLRWPVESKYHELKATLNIEEFNGATSISIQQEFYINLLISNLSALIKNAADEEIERTSKPSNKYKYQANRTFIVGRVRKYFSRIVLGFDEIYTIDKIFHEACNCRSQIQPGRKNKRPRINRNRTHFRNRKVTS
ncbi:MAG: transposase [Lachnospiraceae bacterium]|nr:transposase [Lachnospiraceae bacterium]